jgi:PTH1 family peptidyl-tRNA hydrolase
MKLIVGLGNPGVKYEQTRHNIGFLAVDRLIDDWNASGPVTRNQGEVWTASVAGERVLLIKPSTFMNLSGRCVGPLFHFHKCTPGDLIVLHDDLDLDPLQIRLKTGGGTGGHNGLKSIDEALGPGMNGYHRIRLGIGHPSRLGLRIPPVDYVLQAFPDSEWNEFDSLFGQVREAVELALRGEMTRAMNSFNRKPGADPKGSKKNPA